MRNPQFGMFAFYRTKKLQDAVEICRLIIGSRKGFCKDHLPVCKIKPDHNNWHSCLFCNMIKTGAQPIHFFSCTLGREPNDELFFIVEHLHHLVNKALMVKTIDRYATKPAEDETKRTFEKFLLPEEFESLQV